ncbi:uncharacterized protein LOC118820978 isoform X2 [Colossoma macropomum]|uniref:uncharacterized protein LOC118820978 isoform X2 n=1 Tax=Colossoma macropomum TaxID=42526 RepID=UPI00186468FA|nr:uncharacterized protein LOC118820978 isoform X2 [Colossoma macropomum]
MTPSLQLPNQTNQTQRYSTGHSKGSALSEKDLHSPIYRQRLCCVDASFLCLNRLVESVGLLTPPGFDAAPSMSKAIERRVAVHNDFELVGFNPSATSSPGESSRGQKNKELEEIQKSTDLVCANTVLPRVDPDLDVASWSEDFLNNWHINNFSENEDKTTAAVPKVGTLNKPRDTDLRSNQEHEAQDQVGRCAICNNSGENITLGQLNQEIKRLSIEQRRQAALLRRCDKDKVKLNEEISKLEKAVQERDIIIQKIVGDLNTHTKLIKDKAEYDKVTRELLFNLNRFLQLKLSPWIPVPGPSSR